MVNGLAWACPGRCRLEMWQTKRPAVSPLSSVAILTTVANTSVFCIFFFHFQYQRKGLVGYKEEKCKEMFYTSSTNSPTHYVIPSDIVSNCSLGILWILQSSVWVVWQAWDLEGKKEGGDTPTSVISSYSVTTHNVFGILWPYHHTSCWSLLFKKH